MGGAELTTGRRSGAGLGIGSGVSTMVRIVFFCASAVAARRRSSANFWSASLLRGAPRLLRLLRLESLLRISRSRRGLGVLPFYLFELPRNLVLRAARRRGREAADDGRLEFAVGTGKPVLDALHRVERSR